MNRGDALVRVEGLRKYFVDDDSLIRKLDPRRMPRYVRAVDEVDLTICKGETLALVGESGCGKSTLARAMLRLIEPTDGEVYFGGENVMEYGSKELRQFRSKAQMIFQDPFASLNPRYSVRRTLIEPMKVHGRGNSRAERIEIATNLLNRVGLNEEQLNRYPHEFSGGQRQRIGIARALAVEPTLLVADEPTSALDVSMQAQLLNLLVGLQEEMDLSMLFITHDLSMVRHIADRVSVMYLGRIVETAPVEELFGEPRHPYTQALFSSIQIPDPSVAYERILLEGDVPTPIDPPSGCIFHPRCPEVIPPDNWPGDQTAWRQVLRLKRLVSNGDINPVAVRSQLRTTTEGSVTEADIVDFLYEHHVNTRIDDDLPAEAKTVVVNALRMLVSGDRDAADEILHESYASVCESVNPTRLGEGDHHVDCHLYDTETAREPRRASWSPRKIADADGGGTGKGSSL